LQDRGRAEEVTQDAFLRLYERWSGVVKVDHPEAWVRKVACRSAIRTARRGRSLSLVTSVEDRGAWDCVPDVDLALAVAALPPRQRAAVALFYLEDRSVEEVAQLLGTSTSTVKQHLHRARGRLAALLNDQHEEASGDVS
jgi:RNA polymerase sigma-70 factor (ECF subfamily)